MKTSKDLKRYKRKMKRHQTDSEEEFEKLLLNNDIRYKSQVIVGFYIVDFILPEKLACIEIDGGYHGTEEQIKKDERRSCFIKKCGLSIIRINNDDVKDFNIASLKELPNYTESEFKRTLAMGNAYKGGYMKNNK